MTTRIAALALLLAAPIAAQGAPGQITFAQTSHAFPVTPSAGALTQIAIGDVDGDGNQDVVLGYDGAIHAYLGAGDGSFSAPITTSVTGLGVFHLGLGELDGDGCVDAVTGFGSATVRPSNCDGTFSVGQSLPSLGAADTTLLVHDVNADARPDVTTSSVIDGVMSGYVRTYTGLGDGTFAIGSTHSAFLHDTLVPGDLDDDGFADVIGLGFFNTTYYGASTVPLCCPSLTTLAPISGFVSAGVADVDHNGAPDLIVSRSTSSSPPTYALHAYLGSSLGHFAQAVTSADAVFGAQLGALLAADFDRDGRIDVCGRRGPTASPSLAVVRGGGDGSFALAFSGGVSGQALSAASGDFDGDELPDLAVAHYSQALISILINTTVPSAWVDLGLALAGSNGLPLLSGAGSLTVGSVTTLDLIHAAPSSPAVLVAGGTQLALPILGGVLVPSPEVLVFGLVTSAQGTLAHSFAWPSGIPMGATLYFQAWTADAGAAQGWSASNGLAATVP